LGLFGPDGQEAFGLGFRGLVPQLHLSTSRWCLVVAS
jgi:hypothetical protein